MPPRARRASSRSSRCATYQGCAARRRDGPERHPRATGGRSSVEDVEEGDLSYFAAGLAHSLQGLAPDGCEFVLAFDSGEQSESNALLVTDWIAHLPPDVLAKNFGVPEDVFRNISLNNLWIFRAGDVRVVRRDLGHCIENTGDDVLQLVG